jgi:hypothetical protein
MAWVGFEPVIPAFERAKTVYVLDRAATVIGIILIYQQEISKTALYEISWKFLQKF